MIWLDVVLTMTPTILMAIYVTWRAVRISAYIDSQAGVDKKIECMICMKGVRMMHSIILLMIIFILTQSYWFILNMGKLNIHDDTIHWLWWLFDMGVLLVFNQVITCFESLIKSGHTQCKIRKDEV